jgi:hypothetical protein
MNNVYSDAAIRAVAREYWANPEMTLTEAGRSIGISTSRLATRMAALGIPRRKLSDYTPAARGELHYAWRGDDAHPDAKRMRARRKFEIAGRTCEDCGNSPAVDRHHKDGDTGNNDATNIAFLCRRCHMAADGRLDRFRDARGGRRYGPQPAKPCVQCGAEYKPRRRGLCRKCYDAVYVPPKCRAKYDAKEAA